MGTDSSPLAMQCSSRKQKVLNMENDAAHVDLSRFVAAQNNLYVTVLQELKAGYKQTHWMWYIFPQIKGLGRSETSIFYAINSLQEAHQYLQDHALGQRLIECCQTLLEVEGRTALEIFGNTDAIKLKSCMTLFASISTPGNIFEAVLKKYFQGRQDIHTLEILKNMQK